ncbi:MAG: hypothetical protein QW782_08635 [Candidatus Bathyarchaeia archaeon]
MSRFSKEWEGNAENNAVSKIVGVVKSQQPLKYKVSLAIKRIEAQIQALENAMNNMSQRDKSLFSKIIDALSNHDAKRAIVYANELAEVRRTVNLILNAKLALERVSLRLNTITFVGNVAAAIAPAIGILEDVRSGIASIMPGAEREIDAIKTLLDEVMTEAGQLSGADFSLGSASEEAQKILEEAALVAEEKVKEKLPGLVTSKQAEAEREKFG